MEVKKIAAQAEANHIAICPHNPSGPVANAANLQLAACIPNFTVLETMSADVAHRRVISTEQVIFQDGQMQIPDLPGLGIDLDEAAIAEHPFQPRELRHYTGNLTDIRPPDAGSYFQTSQKR
jgi:galactonate dehydratase